MLNRSGSAMSSLVPIGSNTLNHAHRKSTGRRFASSLAERDFLKA
jgi:hypothetical protein